MLREKREQFLLEGLRYYNEDVERRCIASTGGCFYSPKKADKVGVSEGCMIGRHCPPELQYELDILGQTGDLGASVDTDYIFDKLPKSLQELGSDFLMTCQHLHDNSAYWDEGYFKSDFILLSNIAKYNLNKEVFKEFLT